MKNLVLLHGALGCANDLQAIAAALAASGHTVHSFSFSGHSGMPFKQQFGIPQFAAELEQFIIEKQLGQAAVFGYSMGGYAALYLASQKPQLITKIITLGTKFNWSQEAVDKETRLLNPDKMTEKVPDFAKALEAKHGEAWQTLVTQTANLMREISSENFLGPGTLKNITMPVLLGIGDRDQMVTLEETTAVYKTLPRAAMYMLPATKHPVETIDANLLANLISSFN